MPAFEGSQTMKRSDEMIDMLVSSVRDDTSERDKAVLRRVLCELVRVAQSESMQSLEADFRAAEKAVSSKYRH
jgi:dihydroxyacetone kinase